jgi:hypothetical protein
MTAGNLSSALGWPAASIARKMSLTLHRRVDTARGAGTVSRAVWHDDAIRTVGLHLQWWGRTLCRGDCGWTIRRSQQARLEDARSTGLISRSCTVTRLCVAGPRPRVAHSLAPHQRVGHFGDHKPWHSPVHESTRARRGRPCSSCHRGPFSRWRRRSDCLRQKHPRTREH